MQTVTLLFNTNCFNVSYIGGGSSVGSVSGGSSVGSVSTPQAAVPQSILTSRTFFHGKHNFLFSLIQEEQDISNWRKNGHLILVTCLTPGGLPWNSVDE